MVKLFGRRTIAERAPRVTMLTATDGRDILVNDPAGWEVAQPWLWWTGPAGGNGTGGPYGNPPPGADYDPYGLVSLPAVNRATSLICDTISGLPWHVYKGNDILPTPAWVSDPQNLARDGRNPNTRGPEVINVRLSAVEFWTEWLVSALWLGDGYIYVPQRDAAGAPQPPLWTLNPKHIEIEDGRYYVRDSDEPLDPSQIIHLRGAPPYKGGHGRGVLTSSGLDLALALTVRDYAASQYASGIPYGYLKSSQPRMDETQATDLRNKWIAQHGSSRRSIAVLNATTEFVPLTISPLDAQLSEARTWSLRDIALAFGLPPYMLGVAGDTSTYANVESRGIEFRTYTLLPHIRRIESTLGAELPLGTDLHVETAGLERADTATRYAAYKIALDSGFMTRDEVRALENLPPLGAEADPTLPTATGLNNGNPQPANGVTLRK